MKKKKNGIKTVAQMTSGPQAVINKTIMKRTKLSWIG